MARRNGSSGDGRTGFGAEPNLSSGTSEARPAAASHGAGWMRTVAALLALFLSMVNAELTERAAAAEPLSFEEAVRTARESNPMVLSAQAQGEAARRGHSEAQVSWLPTIVVREIALKTNSPADVFGLQLMQERFSFNDFVQSDPNDPEPLENFSTEIEASMPVFAGGRIWRGISQADKMADAAEEVASHTVGVIELAAASAYMDALLAEQAVDLAERARETTARHVEQAQAYFDAGMMVESDLLQAQIQLARMEEEVIRARNNARLAMAGLNRVMGLEQSHEYELTTALPVLAPPVDSLAAAYQLALARRHDLAAASKQVEAMDQGVSQAWGRYLPEIGLQAKYAWNDRKFFGTSGDSYTIAAAASWEVWNWLRTQQGVERSKLQRDAAVQSRRSLEQKVEFEVRQALFAVEEARSRHQLASRAIEQAEKALQILDDRFSQGVARMTDLLDAETSAHEARLRELQARFDMQKAIRNFFFATGESPVPEVSS